MKKTLSFKTSNGNVYIYSPFRNQILLVHPLIPLFYNAEVNGKKVDVIFYSISQGDTILGIDTKTVTLKEIKQQLLNYRFLKRHGFFRPINQINLDGRLTPAKIEENLSNIQQIIFETTESCNLDCTYCIYSKFYSNQQRGTKKFDIQRARTMLSYIINQRSQSAPKELIISFYGGEPLKNFRFIQQIVDHCHTAFQGFSFHFSLTTNGLLLARHAAFLAKHNFDISISLDGDKEANRYRVLKNKKPAYNLIVQNIDTLREQYPEYFEKHISFLSVLHNQNSHESVFRFFQERYNKTPLVAPINTVDINYDHVDEFKETFLRNRREDCQITNPLSDMFMSHPSVKELSDILEKYSGYVFKNYYQVLAVHKGRQGTQKFIPTATCQPFSMRVYLTTEGSILPCEHISRIFEIGQLEPNDVSIIPEEIANYYNRYFEKVSKLCKDCMIADHCKECIFNTRIDTDDPACDFFTDEATFTKDMAAAMDLVEQDYPMYQRILKEVFYDK